MTSTVTTTTSPAADSVATERDGLTREDVAALRLCDEVRFYRHKDGSFLRAALRGGFAGQARLYTKREQLLFPRTDTLMDSREREIVCVSAVYGYSPNGGRGWNDQQFPGVVCYESYVGGRYTDTWVTLASLLKPGDLLGLRWTADESEMLPRDHGLHRDTLHLVITRSKQTLTFLLADRVSPNNTARMIRRNG